MFIARKWFAFAAFVLPALRASAETSPTIGAAPGLHFADWLVIALFLAGIVWIGWAASRKKEQTSNYLVGDQGFGSFSIGISMFVTLFSTISFLSGPGEVVRYGLGIFLGQILAMPLVYPLLAYWLIPALVKQRKTSLYELLGTRLGPSVRMVSACMFLFYRTLWMAVLMRFASVALSVALGWEPASIPLITIVSGLIVVIYTSVGGFRGVIYTDVLQFFVLVAGLIAAVGVVAFHFRGVGFASIDWNMNWPEQPVFSWDATIRLTLVGAVVRSMILDLAHGVDQTQVQRYVASADIGQARRAVLIRLFGSVFIWSLLVLLGIALVLFYRKYPGALPDGETIASYADRLFPLFIAHQLPIGLAGLLVAALISAAMTGVSSGINSFTVVILKDFIERKGEVTRTEREHKKLAVTVAVMVGLVIIGFSLLIQYVPGSFVEVTSRTFQLLIPLELGIVLLALFVRWATPLGVIWSIFYGFALGVLFSYWSNITGQRSFSFTLHMPFILTMQFTSAALISLIPTKCLSRAQLYAVNVLIAITLGAIIAGVILLGKKG